MTSTEVKESPVKKSPAKAAEAPESNGKKEENGSEEAAEAEDAPAENGDGEEESNDATENGDATGNIHKYFSILAAWPYAPALFILIQMKNIIKLALCSGRLYAIF